MLDLTGLVSLESEQGLLNVTFSSDGSDMFVYYTDLNGDVVVDKYEVDRSDRASYDDRIELIRVPQPAPNHNGGGLAVGPDGFLYIGLGDGGGAGDPEQTGQDPRDLLGSLLRIDPVSSETSTYAVPVSNPFADGVDGAPEVWTYGARNPWRLSFDQLTGDLWIGDVGQNAIEEIDKLAQSDGGGRGANLGWNLVEEISRTRVAKPRRTTRHRSTSTATTAAAARSPAAMSAGPNSCHSSTASTSSATTAPARSSDSRWSTAPCWYGRSR
ncbi:MAG: PQQ-dependent sugar dehydrogenase [Acidimicrobiales bacterium]